MEDSIVPQDLESQSNPTKKFQGKLLPGAIIFVALCLIAVVVGVVQQSKENNQIQQAESAATAVADTSWIPDGYTVFDMNSNIARDTSANPACTGDSTSGKYCWTYKIVTKDDCSKVVGTLQLLNSGNSVATVTGEVDEVTAGTPTVLEIDSGAENDSSVDENTTGNLTSIECS